MPNRKSATAPPRPIVSFPALPPVRAKDVRIALERWRRGLQCRRNSCRAAPSRPSRRWRTRSVMKSISMTVDDNQQKDGADVRVIEFADGLDQVLADPAGADKAHHRRAAYVDLESQQAHSLRSSKAPEAPRQTGRSESSFPRSPPPPRSACYRYSRQLRRTACQARRWYGSRWRERPAAAPDRMPARRSGQRRSPARCGRIRGGAAWQKRSQRDLTRLADARKQRTKPHIAPASVPIYAISNVSPRSRAQRGSPQNHSARSAHAVENENFGAMLAK